MLQRGDRTHPKRVRRHARGEYAEIKASYPCKQLEFSASEVGTLVLLQTCRSQQKSAGIHSALNQLSGMRRGGQSTQHGDDGHLGGADAQSIPQSGRHRVAADQGFAGSK